MTYINTKGKFHVALDGVGLILQGAPERPGYLVTQAPLYGNRFASGDRSYTDFSFWWFWAQTDWSGGYKLEDIWKDDAKFYNSKGVTVSTQPGDAGDVRLNWKQISSASSPSAKNITLKTFDTVLNGNLILAGRNETDGKMIAVDAGGSLIWEDTAVGASETILSSASFADGDMYIGCKTLGSGVSMLKVGSGGTFTDVGTFNIANGVYAVEAYKPANKLFLFVWGSGIWEYDVPTATFTQKKTEFPLNQTSAIYFSFGNQGRSKFATALIGDRIYFTYQSSTGSRTQLWAYDISTDSYVLIYNFNPSLFSIKSYLIERDGNLYIFGVSGGAVWGRIYIFKYDGVRLIQIHKIGRSSDVSFNLHGGVIKDSESIYFVLDDGSSDYQLWQLDNSDALFSGITPPAAYATNIDLLAINNSGNIAVCKNGSGTIIDKFYTVPVSSYQTSGSITTSKFDANIPSIDKLFYAATINFTKLVIGQSIEIQYSIDGGATFTSLGTASYSIDGGSVISKTLSFGSAIVSKTMKLKFILSGDGTNTPTLEAFACQYVPIPIYTKEWSLQIDCADELKTLDGSLVETTGRGLKSRLEKAWWTKALLDFQDLDYATTQLNGAPTNSITTITVDDTKDFPEQGRIRIDDEEILYSGKTPTTFTGCIRGARGTVAVIHTDNTAVNNAYRVLITDLKVRAPILLEDKQLEYIVQIVLREG